MIYVNNPTSGDFPGGNITGYFASPTGKWQVNLQYNVPPIASGQYHMIDQTYKVQESGVYIMTFNPAVTFAKPSPYWGVSGGFLALQVEPPSTLFAFLTLMVLILGFVGTNLTIYRRGRSDQLFRIPPHPSNMVLQKALNLFDAGKKMESYLLDPKDDVRFEAGVSWLLEILGFRAFRLNKGSHGEVLRVGDGQSEVRSADILVHDASKGGFSVVSCTIGMPTSEKRQKIRLTANEVRTEMGNCEPIMVTSVDAGPTVTSEAKQESIVLIDRPKLVSIIELAKTGRFEKAKKFFN